jgi:ADP-ribose pyrophosphatase YjhB (NUDIX family)
LKKHICIVLEEITANLGILPNYPLRMPTQVSAYNIRVYGLWINDQKQVLVTDELRMGQKMTKFPGGGHEVGEGLASAVMREWKEELFSDIQVHKLFYINDFLQVSAFDPKEQLLAIYYLVSPLSTPPVLISLEKYDFEEEVEGAQSFRWIALSEISAQDFSFPIDQIVGSMLREQFEKGLF